MGRPLGAYGPKRKGRFSTADHALVQAAATSELSPEKAAEKLAPLMERSETAIKAGIIRARQELQTQASDYVALHRKAAEKAASKGNSKPVEWMLERLEAGGERVVQPAQTENSPSGIRIILANVRIGGRRDEPVSPVEPSFDQQEAEVIDADQ